MTKVLAGMVLGLFLISFVSAEIAQGSPSMAVAPTSIDDVDRDQSSNNAGGGKSASQEKCLTQWISNDGEHWYKRDLYETKKNGRVSVVDGNKCKVNESLNRARWGWSQDYLRPLYNKHDPMWPSLLWK